MLRTVNTQQQTIVYVGPRFNLGIPEKEAPDWARLIAPEDPTPWTRRFTGRSARS